MRINTRRNPLTTDDVSAALRKPACSHRARVPTYAIVASTFARCRLRVPTRLGLAPLPDQPGAAGGPDRFQTLRLGCMRRTSTPTSSTNPEKPRCTL